MSEQPKKYYVRFSKKEDEDRILDFYSLNAHHNVRKRESELVKKMADDGAVVLIEDDEGTIVAASITYGHKVKDKDGVEHVKWQEIGSTRIVLNGYPGLFDAMVTMQTLRAFLVEPPEDRFVAQMHTAPVQGMAGKLGWRPFEAPDELIEAKLGTVDPNDLKEASREHFYHCGVEALPMMAARMMKALNDPVLENKKTGEKIELDFSKSNFFTLFKDEIRKLAAKDYGDVENPDMKASVKERRNQWMKNFFR
ncbi:MAG: hypothetical protein GC185_00395 [Alphaproteobacteria bacterium]|nr:hypothetical protein [Alphaproteobacteria bacterium]